MENGREYSVKILGTNFDPIKLKLYYVLLILYYFMSPLIQIIFSARLTEVINPNNSVKSPEQSANILFQYSMVMKLFTKNKLVRRIK